LLTAKNGIAAMDMFNGDSYFTPDFIFLDLNMPLMNGSACLTEIKKLKRFLTTPVYIYTTSNDPRDEQNLMQAGAVGFITKPFDINNLINILTYLISPKLQILN
jgi:CheY-like chemotaxis protein